MGFIPVFILAVLFFVMMFGIGFILNMLMKTTCISRLSIRTYYSTRRNLFYLG